MKILITGGSGFIGKELTEFLQKKGYEVYVCDIKPSTVGKYLFCDVTNAIRVMEIMEEIKPEIVYHLAANSYPNLAEKNPHWDLDLNVKGTLNIIQACIKYKSRLVFTSTARVYDFPLGNYANSKLTAENYIRHYCQKENLDAIIVRLNNVYGPNQEGTVVPDLIEKLRTNKEELEIKSTGEEEREFIYVEDVVNALYLIGLKGKSGETYDVHGEKIKIYDLALKIAELMGVNPKIKIKGEKTRKNNFDFRDVRELGWFPTKNLENGLKECLRDKDGEKT